jgi:hypothetical protein
VTELPSWMVTFLFADLEGSTRLWEEYPEAMRVVAARVRLDARGRHHAIAWPPLTRNTLPVAYFDASESR